MAQHSDEKQKIGWRIGKLFLYIAVAMFSCWLSEMYIGRLSMRLFTRTALTQPDMLAAASPFSYRIIARIIVSVAVFSFPILLVGGFEKKPSKWLWIIALLLAVPQLHGKTCLYEDGRLVTTMPLGIIRCEHTLREVNRAEIEVSGRSKVHRSPIRWPTSLTMTLHIPCEKDEDIHVFSIESFKGERENDQLYQMVSLRRRLPSAVISVEPFSELEFKRMIVDEGLNDADLEKLRFLLAPVE